MSQTTEQEIKFALENGYWLREDNIRNPYIKVDVNNGECIFTQIESKLPTYWQGEYCDNNLPKRIFQTLINHPFFDDQQYNVTIYHDGKKIDKITNFMIKITTAERISTYINAIVQNIHTGEKTLYTFMFPQRILGKKKNICDDDLFETNIAVLRF